MSNIYLHPKLDTDKLASPNPYMDNLEKSLKQCHHIVNQKPNSIGVLDFFRHFFKTDLYFINWIEYIPALRFGKLQVFFFLIFLVITRLFRKKIVWVLHNKYAHKKDGHSDGASDIKKKIFELMIKNSDIILTHSTSGIDFIREKFPQHAGKVHYYPHPTANINNSIISPQQDKPYDFLIWGTIHPYKGILEFLQHINDNWQFKPTILIAGKCFDPELDKEIRQQLNDKITYLNEFISFEQLADYIQQSKFVLFTYNSESVLSSGSLMDSITLGGNVIGPDVGAFRDLSEYSFLHTFKTYEQIPGIFQSGISANTTEDLNKFLEENSWESYCYKINEYLD